MDYLVFGEFLNLLLKSLCFWASTIGIYLVTLAGPWLWSGGQRACLLHSFILQNLPTCQMGNLKPVTPEPLTKKFRDFWVLISDQKLLEILCYRFANQLFSFGNCVQKKFQNRQSRFGAVSEARGLAS